MKRSAILSACFALAVSPAAVLAQSASETDSSAKEDTAQGSIYSQGSRASETDGSDTLVVGDSEEEVICQRQKVTGSRVTSRRVCKTAAQWEVEREEQRRNIEKGQNQRTHEG